MGSQPSIPAEGPQHAPPPLWTRSAACPYFSLTTSLISISCLSCNSALEPPRACRSAANCHNCRRFNRFITSAAFRVEEAQQFLQCLRVGRIPEESALAAHLDEVFVPEFVEMVRKRGSGYTKFITDVADDHSGWMRRQQEAHNAQPRPGPDGGEHIREPGYLLIRRFPASRCHRCLLFQ